MLTDVQFLSQPLSQLRGQVIYIYRESSWITKHRVKQHVLTFANHNGWQVLSVDEGGLSAALVGNSLFDMIGTESLVVCDLGEGSGRQLTIDDVEQGLQSLVGGLLNRRLLLMVPSNHPVVDTELWKRALSTLSVMHIEEVIVTRENFPALMKAFASSCDLKGLPQFIKTRLFRHHFLQFIPENGCTMSEVSMEIDRFVLLGYAENRSKKASHRLAPHRQAIGIVIRRFLDRRDEATLRSLLVHVDRLLFTDMMNRSDVIARLYRAAESIVGGQDKRYKDRNVPSWSYFAWGALVLSCDWSGAKDEGSRSGLVIAFERICREFMRVVDPKDWLQQTGRWQEIVMEIDRTMEDDPERTEIQKRNLISALRERSVLLGASYPWLKFPALDQSCSDEALMN